jgi:hypothetical protein
MLYNQSTAWNTESKVDTDLIHPHDVISRSSKLTTAVFHISLLSVHYADCNIHVEAPIRATERAV